MTEWRMGRWTNRQRIWLDFPYDHGHKEFIKNSVPGARWSSEERFWHFPLDMEVAKDIYRVSKELGVRLIIQPELVAWLNAEKKRLKSVLRPDDLDADVSNHLPWLRAHRPDIIDAMERKPWQIPATAFMVAQRRVILADKPGLGKTLETIAALLELQVTGPILIVAPRTAARITWPQEIRQWVGEDEKIFVINAEVKPKERVERVKQVEALANSGQRVWVLLGPNYLRIRADTDAFGKILRDNRNKKIIRPVNEAVGELFSIKWNAVVVDESHLSLAGGSAGVGKTKWSAQRLGLDALTIRPDAPRFALSGTPFRGKTENLWGTLNWIDKKKHSSYWNWIKRHYGVHDAFHAAGDSHLVKGDQIVDKKRFYESLAPYMVRRTKEEIQRKLPPEKRLPPKEYEGTHLIPHDDTSPKGVWLELTPQQRKQYDKIVDDAMVYVDDIALYNVNGALAEMTRFKQLANSCLGPPDDRGKLTSVLPSNKIDWVVDFLKDRQQAGTKVIVASQFTGFLNALSAQLNSAKLKHYLYTGQTKDADREQIKDAFQKEEGTDLFILVNTMAAGYSLTLDMADDVVICDSTWNPDDQEQVEDRAHRSASDRIHNVSIWYLYSLDTIDEDIAIINNQRSTEITGVLDDERSKSFADKVIAMTKARQAARKAA